MIQLTDTEVLALGTGGLVWRDGFLDPQLGDAARELLRTWQRDGRLTPAGVGRNGTTTGIRGDVTVWLEPDDPGPLAEVFACFDLLRLELTEQLRLSLQRFTLQAAHYEPGAGYLPHCDAFTGDPGRILTAIVYLNGDWVPEHGGLLHAWTPDGRVDIEPRLGRLVLFRSDTVRHQVQPSRATRWAVTAWYRGAEPIPMCPDPSR